MRKEILLDEWQKEVLEAKGNVLLCTGRQVGKTTIFARKAAERLLQQPHCQIIVVSLTEDQAKLIIIMILDFLEKNARKEVARGKDKPTQNRITLRNGSSVLARPVGNTGDAVRGFTGDVLIIDEASRMSELIWTASRPTLLTTAGEIWLCSTPFGKQGYFWEAFQNKNNRFKVFHISSEEVIKNRPISEGWTETQRNEGIKFLEREKADMTQVKYGQEYMGLFLDELRKFFEDELIERASTQEKDPKKQGDRFLGVDIGRMYDPSAFEDVAKIGEKVYHVDSQITKKTLTTETQNKIIEMDRAVNYKEIGIDAGSGSLGVGVYDNLMEDDNVKRKLVAMNNRSVALNRDGTKSQRLMKEDFYNNLKAMMEHGTIKLLNDDQVKASLRSVQWELINEEDQQSKIRIYGNDTHIVEGLARAAWLAAKAKDLNVWIRTIKI